MTDESKEKLQASNIVWNASEDYSFQPKIKAYDENGKADIYWNYIIGAAHKYYDYSVLQSFFDQMKDVENGEFYQKLVWLGLEHGIYEKGRKERPALENIRLNYAKQVTAKPSYELFDVIKDAYFKKVLGKNVKVDSTIQHILEDLECDEALETEQIVEQMKGLLKEYFMFSPLETRVNEKHKIFKNRKLIHWGWRRKPDYTGTPYHKRFDIGNAESSSGVHFQEDLKQENKFKIQWLKFVEKVDRNEKDYMKDYFGTSILAESDIKAMEQALCTENHRGCHLHFTRGEYEESEKAVFHKETSLKQQKANKKYYLENLERNKITINRLTSRILNTMQANLETSQIRGKSGTLEAGRIWRNLYLHDSNIFTKEIRDTLPDITVDLMLDASASQLYRQEIIAEEAYIIAESLTRCHIPVRVYSFCNMRRYTIFRIYRDYYEDEKNHNIFSYYAAGFNRDGLAIRTALHMMKNNPVENKILILLSDSRPSDLQNIPDGGILPSSYEYTGDTAVHDTAREVQKGKNSGIPILCVFTGKEEDLPSAKKIYGHNYAHIQSPERFADIVGVLIQNVLMNLW